MDRKERNNKKDSSWWTIAYTPATAHLSTPWVILTKTGLHWYSSAGWLGHLKLQLLQLSYCRLFWSQWILPYIALSSDSNAFAPHSNMCSASLPYVSSHYISAVLFPALPCFLCIAPALFLVYKPSALYSKYFSHNFNYHLNKQLPIEVRIQHFSNLCLF